MVLQTAWKIDRYNDYQRVREDIAGIKVAAQKILHDIVGRAIQVHGAIGVSNEMPLWRMYQDQFTTGFSDGPSEVHKSTVARRVVKKYSAAPGLWPTEHLPTRRAEAQAQARGPTQRAAGPDRRIEGPLVGRGRRQAGAATIDPRRGDGSNEPSRREFAPAGRGRIVPRTGCRPADR